MAGWPEGLLINKSIHRNIDSVLGFRFRPHYVNSLLLIIFFLMLHNLNYREEMPGMMKSQVCIDLNDLW